MSQSKTFRFGVDFVSFIDAEYNVYSINDPQTATINLTYEIAEHRGGANNDLRKTAIHSRNGEFKLGTGYADVKLAQLLTGGTITSLGTSSASITTGTATGINTLYGTTASIHTAILSVVINSPTVVKTSDYYLGTSTGSQVVVTRVFDGLEYPVATLTASTVTNIASGAIALHVGATGIGSLVTGEKAYFSVRSAINSLNQKVTFDSTKPSTLSAVVTVDFDGYRQTITIPNVQPQGTIQGSGASEFQVQDLTMKIYADTLDRLAEFVIHG
jgi:hypothetical protein